MIKNWLIKKWHLIAQTYVGYKIHRLKIKADRYSAKNGVQVFIIKHQGKIINVTKEWFTYNKQHNKFPKNFTVDDLKKISFYYTKK